MDFVYNVMFYPEPEGGFTAVVPSLPGCVTYGKTLPKAQKMVTEAIELYLSVLKDQGEPIPSDESAFVSSVRIQKTGKRHKAYAA